MPSSKKSKGILVIRPHGSLKWTRNGLWIKEKGWVSWSSLDVDTPISNLGYRNLSEEGLKNFFYIFRQPMIVAPDDYKEEVVGNSTVPGLIDPMLKRQWLEFYTQLENANTWLIIGASLESGDDHLIYLLRRHLVDSKNPTEIHIDCHKHKNHCGKSSCSKVSKLWAGLGLNKAKHTLCYHPTDDNQNYGTIDLKNGKRFFPNKKESESGWT